MTDSEGTRLTWYGKGGEVVNSMVTCVTHFHELNTDNWALEGEAGGRLEMETV